MRVSVVSFLGGYGLSSSYSLFLFAFVLLFELEAMISVFIVCVVG